MQTHGADFLLSLLANQKLNQVNVQYIMKEATKLINLAIKQKLDEAASILSTNNVDPTCLSTLTEGLQDPFDCLHNQRAQNIFFTREFGNKFLLIFNVRKVQGRFFCF